MEKKILNLILRLKLNPYFSKASSPNTFTILAYHEIEKSNFDNHVTYLKTNGYQIISIDGLFNLSTQPGNLPPKAVIMTFDDGWKSNYSDVFPIAQKYGIPFIIYLVSQSYLTDFKAWFFTMAELKSSGISDIPRDSEWSMLDDKGKNRMAHELRKKYGNLISKSHILSLDEIVRMQNSGLASFGSHTTSHVRLNQLSEAEVKQELVASKLELESILNKPVEHFAYPQGYYNPKHFKCLRSAGYKTAVTAVPGLNNFQKGTHPFELRRIFISGKDDVSILAAKLSGIWYKLHRIRFYEY